MAAFRREWAQHPLARLRTANVEAHELLARMLARYPGKDLTGPSPDASAAAPLRMMRSIVAPVPGTHVTVKRVPELTPRDIAVAAGFRLDQPAPVAEPAELADYDAIIFGTPTRFGNMASQMRNFLDQTGPLWMKNALVGKVG